MNLLSKEVTDLDLKFGVDEMVQLVNVLGAKSDILNLIPNMHIVKEYNIYKLFYDLSISAVVYKNPPIYT